MTSTYEKLETFLTDPQTVVRFQRACGIETLDANDPRCKEFLRDQNETLSGTNNGVRRRATEPVTASDSANHGELPDHGNTSSTNGTVYQQSASKVHHDGSSCYLVHNHFWYWAFHFGAALGNEIFYMTFFPFWFWNVDGFVGRRICLFWCMFMYAGQALKDLLKRPRPASPPVIRVERLYELEYGMPSTHAMVGAGMPFSIYFLTASRYNYDSEFMLLGAIAWCALVCCSRVYLGMHSLLDIIAGLAFVFFLMLICFPALDIIDYFILHSPVSPMVCIIVPIILCFVYPTPDRWSTAKGDTTLILAVVSGISIGHWISYQCGVMTKAATLPPYDIIQPTWTWAGLVIVRMCLGVVFVICLRAALKLAVSHLVHYIAIDICGVARHGEVGKPDRRPCIELPIKFLTYALLSAVCIHIVPLVFHRLGIERETFFTEI